MKKFLPLFIAMLFCTSCLVQKNNIVKKTASSACVNPEIQKSGKSTTYRYTYNFSDLRSDSDCNILPKHQKSSVFIRVININRLVYDINANGSSQSLPLDKISLFDSLVTSLKTGTINPATTPLEEPPSETRQKKDENKNLLFRTEKGVRKPAMEENPYHKEKTQILAYQKKINDDFSAWIDDLKALEKFLKYAKNVSVIIGGECCNQSNLKTKLLSDPNLISFDPSIAGNYTNLMSVISTQPSSLAENIKRKLSEMLEWKQKADELINDIKKDCKRKRIQDSDECHVDAFEDNFPVDFAKAVQEAQKIDAGKVTEVAGEIIILLQKANDPKNFFYQLNNPFRIEGDWYDAKILFHPKKAYTNSITPDSIIYRFPVKGKFEWAIGPALNFHFTKSMFDESFHVDSARNVSGKAKADTFNISKNTVRNRLIPSIGFMGHFYWQNHTSITRGIVLGLSTSPADLKDLRAYIGSSFMIGSITDKVFLNVGFAFGWADRLKSNLQIGENKKSQIPFNGDNIASPDQFVERAFQIGGFAGFTYKLSK